MTDTEQKTYSIATSCQDIDCATETSYPIDMLRWWYGRPICEECFAELPTARKLDPSSDDDECIHWHDLEPLTIEQARP